MFLFPEKQALYNIGGVRVGGQLRNPCTLVGTIFYSRQGITRKGGFNRKKAGRLIRTQEDLSAKTGLGCMLDVYADSVEKIREYIDFVSEVTDLPFMVDSTDAVVRLAGVEYAEEIGLVDKVAYNSINMSVTCDEVEYLKNSGVNTALLMAFNPVDNSLKGRVDLLKSGGGVINRGLIDVADECGIKKKLIDTGITPLGSGAGSALRAVTVCKSIFRYPVGNAIHNAVYACDWMKTSRWDIRQIDYASNVILRVLGSDFILYGPIENARQVFMNLALTECFIGEALEEMGVKLDGNHPYNIMV